MRYVLLFDGNFIFLMIIHIVRFLVDYYLTNS